MAHGEIPPAEHLATCPRAHQRGQVVLRDEGGDHFAGTQRVFVDEDHYLPVKRFRAKAFRHQSNRTVPMPHEKSERHLQHVELGRRQPVDARELVGFPPAVFAFPREAVANRKALWRQMAHQPKRSNESAQIPT